MLESSGPKPRENGDNGRKKDGGKGSAKGAIVGVFVAVAAAGGVLAAAYFAGSGSSGSSAGNGVRIDASLVADSNSTAAGSGAGAAQNAGNGAGTGANVNSGGLTSNSAWAAGPDAHTASEYGDFAGARDWNFDNTDYGNALEGRRAEQVESPVTVSFDVTEDLSNEPNVVFYLFFTNMMLDVPGTPTLTAPGGEVYYPDDVNRSHDGFITFKASNPARGAWLAEFPSAYYGMYMFRCVKESEFDIYRHPEDHNMYSMTSDGNVDVDRSRVSGDGSGADGNRSAASSSASERPPVSASSSSGTSEPSASSSSASYSIPGLAPYSW